MSIPEISNRTIVPLSLGLLAALVVGVWTLAMEINKFKNRLDQLDMGLRSQWSFAMENDSWSEFSRKNPEISTPDIHRIREWHNSF